MVFTPRFWWLFAAGGAFALLGFVSQGLVAYMVVWDLALLTIAVVSYRTMSPQNRIRISRTHDPVFSARVANVVTLHVTNEGRRVLKATVQDEPPAEFEVDRRRFDVLLHPYREVALRYHVTPLRRGVFAFREVFVLADAPLGLVRRKYRLTVPGQADVYPNILALRKYDLLRRRGHLKEIGVRRASLKGVGSEFESLREYRLGDDVRRLDWKATARRGKPIVREYEAERSQPVILALDLGRLMMAEVEGVAKYDHVIDAALMLAHAAVEARDRVGLLLYHDRVVRFLVPQKGRVQIGRVLEELHGLEPQPVESDLQRALRHLRSRWRRRSLVVVFTDVVEAETSARTLEALVGLGRYHVCVGVLVSDSRLKELSTRSPTAPRELYERAVAIQLLDERRAAVTRLRNAGIRVVDAEPEHLAAALVNEYTAIKTRALI